jgi:cytochrome d ubiquinol oxidase subunit II
MNADGSALVLIWTCILGLAVFLYVLLDGFDLGVGMLFGLARTTAQRNTLMNSIAPVWDGNETWLILGGIGLLAAFPLAFAIIMPAIYFPIGIMLLALVFRGVAFEFRYRDLERKTFWDHGFAFGSAVATFAQGIVLGAYVQGFNVQGRQFVGSSFDCFTPFSVFTGVALMCGYVLLGAAWLIIKTQGDLQEYARRFGQLALLGMILCTLIVSLWTPALDPEIRRRWLSIPNAYYLAPVPLLTIFLSISAWRSFGDQRSEFAPFFWSIGLFLLAYLGVVISLWPMVVPHRYSLWEAASSPQTQKFLLVGTVILLPIILSYIGWSYRVFRGKARADVHHGT